MSKPRSPNSLQAEGNGAKDGARGRNTPRSYPEYGNATNHHEKASQPTTMKGQQ